MGGACVDIPQTHRSVITPTCDSVSIRTERYTIDIIRMPGEGAYGGACVDIPQTHRSVITPTCDSVSIRTERYTIDIIRMPGERAYEVSVLTSHRRMVASSHPPLLAIVFPSGLNDTLST